MIRSVVKGVGTYLPQRVMTNKEFEAKLETTDAWIQERTGIKQRHIAAEGERTSDLGTQAAKAALANAGFTANDIDLVLVATTTPDETMPSTATRIQHKLGITQGAAFDLNAACSGYVYALTVADALLKAGTAKRALVIGAETYSRILNWEDRGTCILFGDGAGCVVLEAQDEKQAGDRGILYAKVHSDGQYGDLLATTGGVSSTQTAGTLFMNGKEIFRHAVTKMGESVDSAMKSLNLPLSAIDWLVPHQANSRILATMGEKLGIPVEKVVVAVPFHANTSAASIPLALDLALKEKKILGNQLLALTALGAGLTWGTCIIRW